MNKLICGVVLTFALMQAIAAEPNDCVCTEEFVPVCSIDGKTYGNECVAKCDKALIAYKGECKEECASCPSAWKPVCDAEDEEAAATAATYGNACFAGCNGVELPVRLGGNCKSLAGCVCTQQFAPVCGADGITYGNAGCAACADVPAVSDGECTVDDYDDDGKEDPDPKEIIPDANKNDRNPPCSDGDDKGACDCEDVIDIVCGADGTTYSNGCLADCSGTEVAAAGPCGADLDACDVCEDNKDQWSPVCLISSKKSRSRTHGHGRGRKLAHKESKSSMTKSYSNPCYASCEGGAGKKDGLYQGECQSQCDDKCAKESMEPMCCSDGEEYPSYKEYPNKCYASCLGGMNGRKTKKMCSRGKCAGKEAVSLLESTPCIPGGAVVRCFADPCSVTSCKADSSALCVSTYCEKFYGFEFIEAGCTATFLDAKTGRVVDCDCDDAK